MPRRKPYRPFEINWLPTLSIALILVYSLALLYAVKRARVCLSCPLPKEELVQLLPRGFSSKISGKIGRAHV